ncbi:C1 family peptidase [candidate division WOR-3 bacterium]|nr:C1 family peptidase [candidate division WOR-3 bacterium]
MLNCTPSRDTEKDWQFKHAAAAGLVRAAPPPPAKDLRESWWAVGNQGYTGSCVGWAAADGVLRWHFAKAGRITTQERLSPRFIWMAAKETDVFTSYASTFIESDGTSLKAALDIARKFGTVRDALLPMDPPRLYPGEPETFYTLAAQLRILCYHNLGASPADWRNWLAFHGPILARVEVDDTWDNATATSGRLDTYRPPSGPAGHAVAIVGYTPDRFIYRNSWGKGWGDRGFGYASLPYAKAATREAYGVTI